jgi:hypothetical protein
MSQIPVELQEFISATHRIASHNGLGGRYRTTHGLKLDW